MIATCDERAITQCAVHVQCANGKPQFIRMWVVFVNFLPLSFNAVS